MAFDDVTGVWQSVGVWNGEEVTALAAGASGELFAALLQWPVTSPFPCRLMEWNGLAWSQLGGAFDRPVMSATVLPNGNLIVGGDFSAAGSVAVANVARWDGSSWNPMGNGLGSYCDELLTMPNGDALAGGFFGAARWDGVAWTQLGSLPGWCLALAVLPNGDVAAGLDYNAVLRWDGASWIPVGGAVLPHPIAYIEALAVLPNGDLVAAEGTYNLGGTFPRIARWDGAAWTPIGTTDSAVRTLTVRPGAGFDLIAGGGFTNVNGLATTDVARLTTPCPAAVTTTASGCPGIGATFAVDPPWVGSMWHATASGLPQPAFGVGVYGFAPVVTPLSSLLPQAVAGCTLRVSPDILQFLPVANGVASASWQVPNLVALAGAQFHHQIVALQFGAGLAIVSATATDAAQLTVGAF